MNRARSRRLVGALATAAGIPLLALAFASPASAATSGDWAASTPASTVQPGSTTSHQIRFTCDSPDGCDYSSALDIRSQAVNGATFVNDFLPGMAVPLSLDTGTTTLTPLGDCAITATDVVCTFSGSGHANQGDTIIGGPVGKIHLVVPDSIGPDTVVARDHLASADPGNDQSNDTALVSTPAAAGTPSGDWGRVQDQYTVAPGGVTQQDADFVCNTAAGCDYDSTLGLTIQPLGGASFTDVSPTPLWLVTDGVADVGLGGCQVQTDGAVCTIGSTGHVAAGVHLTAHFQLDVPASTPANTRVMYAHINPGAGVWSGNDETNDSVYTVTPPVNDSPMADWTIGGGVLGGIALLAGLGALARRLRSVTA